MKGRDFAARSDRLGPTTPRRRDSGFRRSCLGAGLLALAVLYSMCRIPDWSGSDPREISPAEQREAARSPMVSEEHRRAIVVAVKRRLFEDAKLLLEIEAERSPAAQDAAATLEMLRDYLGD